METREFAEALNSLVAFVAENLPDDWQFEFNATGCGNGSGEASFELFDPCGDSVEVCCDDLNLAESIVEHVNQARSCQAAEDEQPQPEPLDWSP